MLKIAMIVAIGIAVFLLLNPRHESGLASSEITVPGLKACVKIHGDEATRKRNFDDCMHSCTDRKSDGFRRCGETCFKISDEFGRCIAKVYVPDIQP